MENKKAFTLIELIVVVTIIWILATIWFLSFQWNTAKTRNSARVENLTNINKSFVMFLSKSWYLPKPDWYKEITYSGWVIFYQWYFWDNTKRILWNFSKMPKDPLTESNYTYSLLNDNQQFELSTVFEWDKQQLWFNELYANWDRIGHTYTYGSFNWKIIWLKTSTWNLILAIPSLILSDISNTDIITNLNNHKLTYNGLTLLPQTYINSSFINRNDNINLVNTWSIVVYNWNFSELMNSKIKQINFLSNLQKAYTWTYLADNKNIKYILDVNISNVLISWDTAKRILSKSIFKNARLRD